MFPTGVLPALVAAVCAALTSVSSTSGVNHPRPIYNPRVSYPPSFKIRRDGI